MVEIQDRLPTFSAPPNDLQTTDDASGRSPPWGTAAYNHIPAKTLQKSKCIPRAVRSLNPHGGFQDPL